MAFQATASTDYDELFAYLERKILEERCEARVTFPPESASDSLLFSCFQAFIDKYKAALDEVAYGFASHEVRFLPRERAADLSEEKHYDALASTYDSDYYLTDCGGHDTFRASGGTMLDSRLGSLFDLIDPREEDSILDVGCGRGELSYQLSKFCRKVTAVDYSKDAIRIAKETYEKLSTEDRLQYSCTDILTMPDTASFDKIVLADVYEHIDADVMEKLLPKLRDMMAEGGKLFVHTAPNLDWYEKVYPKQRREALRQRRYLPKNPRSYYEKLMHINEQSSRSLHDTLARYFGDVIVWNGTVPGMEDFNDFTGVPRENDIFAVASRSSLQPFKEGLFMQPVTDGSLRFRLSVLAPPAPILQGLTGTIPLRVTNLSPVPVRSQNPCPVNLSYHVLSESGETVLFDGVRTRLPKTLYPGEQADCLLEFDGEPLERGQYTLQISLVQEQVAWLEETVSCPVEVH